MADPIKFSSMPAADVTALRTKLGVLGMGTITGDDGTDYSVFSDTKTDGTVFAFYSIQIDVSIVDTGGGTYVFRFGSAITSGDTALIFYERT